MIPALLAALALSFPQEAPEAPSSRSALTHGPFVGPVTHESARLWARGAEPGVYTLFVLAEDGNPVARVEASASTESDLCLHWLVEGLASGHAYRYGIARAGVPLAAGDDYRFRTAPATDAPVRVRLAFGSCANDRLYEHQPVWDRIRAVGADAIVLLGDTPYIDSTDLAVQRERYRAFYALPELERCLRGTPWWDTWDDHDFGRNDTDGNLEGREEARRAFCEYHADPRPGTGTEGVFTRLRWGPVEVFLLDTRWFAGTGPSPVDASRPTLLGAAQWTWLTEGLAASTAPFKLVASGMIWNGAVRPRKTDHWMTYPHEREALFRFIGDRRIPGVVLIGGDIHRSRALRHPTADVAGYELTELITSPMANSVIEAANAPHPALLHDAGEPMTFLLMTVDATLAPPTLLAQFLDAEGRELFAVSLSSGDLIAPR